MTAAPRSPTASVAEIPAVVPFPRLPITLVPDSRLLRYYFLTSLLAGPFFFVLLIPLYFRYRSLRYTVDEQGIAMRWGVLIRREVSLTYARIQDIHLASNIVERWLGLGRILVQTASGSASAEMTIEGIPGHEGVRDFLYARMRGTRQRPREGSTDPAVALSREELSELVTTLREVAAEVRALRGAISTASREEGIR